MNYVTHVFFVNIVSVSFNIVVLALLLAVRPLAFLSHPKILCLLRLKAFFLFPAGTSFHVTNSISKKKCVT